MEYRRAGKADIEQFIEHRVEFVTSIRNINDLEDFRETTEVYLKEHIEKDDLLIFLAIDCGKIVASCMACIFVTAPLPSCTSGKCAEVLNVYTVNEYRKRGCAKKLMILLLNETKRRGVQKLLLEYTDDGFHLYQKLGFQDSDRQMVLKL